ncbi:hypothetical protein SAMN04487857_103210 [Pseudomonas sp. ok272]|nr:hypothetical protein SAMN04487857_103210 [Pseudomonas sp. ok272]SFM48824.1 hypothetical protein SAMN04487858_103225 [Pseudomonas sp. ok602]
MFLFLLEVGVQTQASTEHTQAIARTKLLQITKTPKQMPLDCPAKTPKARATRAGDE